MSRTNSSATPLKAQAKRLRTHLDALGLSVSHSQALEAVAKTHGFPDWNTASAAVGASGVLRSLPRFGNDETEEAERGWSSTARGLGICGVFKPGRILCRLDHDHAGRHDFGETTEEGSQGLTREQAIAILDRVTDVDNAWEMACEAVFQWGEADADTPCPTFDEVIAAISGRTGKTSLVRRALYDQKAADCAQARKMAHALRSEAGWEATWPLPWEQTGQPKDIIVNGQPFTETQDTLSYENVLLLAYPQSAPTRILSVTWSDRKGGGGSLEPGESVRVVPGMVFNAMDTSSA